MYITPNLNAFERKESSQNTEDGVLEKIASDLGIEKGTFFELGVGKAVADNSMEGNFVLLRKNGWRGVFLDRGTYPDHFGIRQEFISALNINQLYLKHGLTEDLDFMSIDVDGQEFWIWMGLSYRPKVMVIEINGANGMEHSVTIQFDLTHIYDGTSYHGASIRAMEKLAKAKEYTLVWCNGVNAIYIRDDLISNKTDFRLEEIFRPWPPHYQDPLNRLWVKI